MAGRREEIVAASLALLVEHRVDQLTTRTVARAVGISQPGLFRHFRSREEILLAVVAKARQDIGSLLESVVREQEAPLDVVASLLAGLLNHVERHPGLPRLLFHDVASGSQDALRAGLSHLASAQEGFVAEMVREAVKEQALPASVEPSYAGQMFGLLIQGFVLQWLRNGRPDGLSQFAPQLFSFWLSGLQGGGGGQPVPREDEEKREALLALDVRPLIRDGVDPLQVILRHLSQLDSRGLLILRAPFRPAPLLALLSKRGHLLQEMDHDDQGWEVLVSGLNAPPLLALADLPPPGPLQKVLVELETLASGRCLLAHTPRVPQILLGALSEQRRPHCAESLADGTAVVWVGPTE